jgi:hypothetical protein
MYDSISGHGLMMIGNATKNVVAFQNYSTACRFCDRHSKILDYAEDTTVPPDPVPAHRCPKIMSVAQKA